MLDFEVHRRQWIISRRGDLPSALGHFHTVPLSPTTYLHHHPDLNVTEAGQKLVLGDFIGDFASATTAHYMTGRFVVIEWPWLSLDAVGSMGVYCLKGHPEHVCSSSMALLSEITGIPLAGRMLARTMPLNWDPLPSGRMKGARKLFCDQSLNLETGQKKTLQRCIRSDISESDAVNIVAQHVADVTAIAGKRGARTILRLTAGKDSRLLFSALIATGTPFIAITHIHTKPSRTDATVAARLCKRYGITHHVIEAHGNNAVAAAALARHTGGSEAELGQTGAIGNRFRYLRRDDVIFSGNVFEVGRRFYDQRFRDVDFSQSRSAAHGIASAFEDTDPVVIPPLRAWHRYRTKHPINGLDFTEQFYLDQVLGGWMACILQGQDIYPGTMYAPASSWRCIDALMAGSAPDKSAGTTQIAAMERLCPGISTVMPFNPRNPIRQAIKSAIVGSSLEGPARLALRGIRRRVKGLAS